MENSEFLKTHEKSNKQSIYSPTKRNGQINKSIKFNIETNNNLNHDININSTNSARNSSFFQNFQEFPMYNDNGMLSPLKRKRTTSMSLGKLMSRLKMGMNNMTVSTNFHRNLINELNEMKKDANQLNSLDNYSKEELIALGTIILQKPSYQRSQFDIKMLVKCTESVKFFADMILNNDYSTHEQCCRVMVHKFFRGGEVVFKEGSVGSTFFIILKGSVGVYIPDKEKRGSITKISLESENSPRNHKKNSIVSAPLESNSSFKFKMVRLNTLDEAISKIHNNEPKSASMVLDKKPSLSANKFKEAMTQAKERNNEENLNKVKVLIQGQAFGELALLDNKPRAATIICEEDCYFAVLEKQFFTEILKEKETKKLYSQIEFFASMKMFKLWSFNAVKQLFLTTTQLEFKKNIFVFNEGDAVGDLYLIKSGEFRILKQLQWEKTTNKTSADNYMINKQLKYTHTFELGILGAGESFGEEELVKGGDRICSVICSTSSGVLYVLKKKDFIKRVLQDKNAHKCLEEQIEAKTQWRMKRIQEFFELLTQKKLEQPKHKKSLTVSQGLLEMEKNRTPRNINVISNKPKKLLDLTDQISKKKQYLIPIDKSFFDPNRLQEILKESSVLKLLSSGSHKRNFMILNAFLKQQINPNPNNTNSTKHNAKNNGKFRNFSEPNLKKNKKILTENTNLDVTQKDTSDVFKYTILPNLNETTSRIRNNSFFQDDIHNQYLKKRENIRKYFLDNPLTTRKKCEKYDRIHDLLKTQDYNIHKKKSSFGDLPLKYFSENIKNSNLLKKNY